MNRRPWTWGVLALAIGCDPVARSHGEADEFRGEALECVDPGSAYQTYEDEYARISSPSRLESLGDELELDKGGTTVTIDKAATYVCRCDGGCGGSVCQVSAGPIDAICTGTCDGTISSDGRPCWGCGWHRADPPPNPADPGSGQLDPTNTPDPKPPGSDPGPGSVDPTF
jgi:hypothetical protein